MELFITILWFIAYSTVGFGLAVVFRAFDEKPSKTDDSFYATFIFIWPIMLLVWVGYNGVGWIGKLTQMLAEKIKPGCTKIPEKTDVQGK